MNLIIQHWDGSLPKWGRVAKESMERYAKAIGADYELVAGMPYGKKVGPYFQKLFMLDEKFDGYDNVLLLDMDTVATGENEDVFDAPGIGVLHDRAMKGASRTPPGAPGLYCKGLPIFFGNFIKLDRSSRLALREHLDIPLFEKEILDPYAGDEIGWHRLFYMSKILEGRSYEEICMRCSGTSHEDIHFREHNRLDRKFCNMPRDADEDASLLHFCKGKKDILRYRGILKEVVRK